MMCELCLNKVVTQNKMKPSVNARVAQCSGRELRPPDSHVLGLQWENCFMGDSTAGIMKKRQENKVNRSLFLANDSQTPIPLIRTASMT